MSEEKKLAVLIDSDNVSAKYAQFVMNEVQKYGVPTYKRVYGDWEKGGNGWHAPAVNYSIMPVQQTSYVAGKNATDFSMISTRWTFCTPAMLTDLCSSPATATSRGLRYAFARQESLW